MRATARSRSSSLAARARTRRHQASTLPPSDVAPPTRLLRPSTRYRQSPQGVVALAPNSPGETMRIADDVPTLSATRSGPEQSDPRFEQAPSPWAGYHGTWASAGQRDAKRGVSP